MELALVARFRRGALHHHPGDGADVQNNPPDAPLHTPAC
jgi:hypothetical protein